MQMFTSLFVKKKLSHKQIAFKFVHHTLQIIDETYGDFLDAIFYDPELTEHPKLDYKDPTKLSFIIIAGNMKYFEQIYLPIKKIICAKQLLKKWQLFMKLASMRCKLN